MYCIYDLLDGVSSKTTEEQAETEDLCRKLMKKSMGKPIDSIKLYKSTHVNFLRKSLEKLPARWTSLDASRTWFVYWITHSLTCLGEFDADEFRDRVTNFISSCAHPSGGYGGGNMQLPHLAATYAAVCALATVGGESAFKSVDRQGMYRFILSCRHPEGGFCMHEDGERDTRAAYCAVATASMLGIVTDELFEGLPDYLRAIQNWEGGLGGEPGTEAHGGFTFCGLAALGILSDEPWNVVDLPALLHWVVSRQMGVEGGFCGRTNKLVDACYSWWCGAVPPIIHRMMASAAYDSAEKSCPPSLPLPPKEHAWMNAQRAQLYILQCCQDVDVIGARGGVRDKPGKKADHYHCCYGLGGLALNQAWPSSGQWVGEGAVDDEGHHAFCPLRGPPGGVFGNPENDLPVTPHVLFNVSEAKILEMLEYFSKEENIFEPAGRPGVRGHVGKGAKMACWKGPFRAELRTKGGELIEEC